LKKILISWIADKNDFEKGGKVNVDGPTFSFHQHFFQGYEKHLLLSGASGDQTKFTFLLNALRRNFPDHAVQGRYMNVRDVIDLEQIRSKIEPLLLEYRNYEIDIFYSPGTSAMQIAWVLAHMTLGLPTRLLQTRPKKYTDDRSRPELLEVKIDKDAFTASAIIRQQETERSTSDNEKEVLITESIKPVYEQARRVAQAEFTTVLILGQSGTGKEHLAQYIHRESPRRDQSFEAVNCSALHDQLLESRLFGYKKGAFTGAEKDTPGLLELAEGGTVFLDEIGDISPYMQQSLLRVLQEREIIPIGGAAKKIDVRFIAATNKDLQQLCTEGKFRWDLYYRLAVVDLSLPALATRGNREKSQLIDFFLKEKKELFNTPAKLRLPKKIRERLLAYPFPGNIRELENVIERLYALSAGQGITLNDLPQRILNPDTAHSLLLKDVEKQHLERVLQMNDFNQRKTARDVGIAVNTLRSKIERYGIGLSNK